MKKFSADETLKYIIQLLLYYLDEIGDIGEAGGDRFLYGEKTAYTECLEIIQYWEKACEYGLNFEVERKYPL